MFIFALPTGVIVGCNRKRFAFYPMRRNRQFQFFQRDKRQCNAHFLFHMFRCGIIVAPLHIVQREYCFSNLSLSGFWRCLFLDGLQTSPHAFFCFIFYIGGSDRRSSHPKLCHIFIKVQARNELFLN